MKKFIGLVFFTLQLSGSFIDNSLQVVCVFFHHREHVVYYTDGSERKRKKRKLKEDFSRDKSPPKRKGLIQPSHRASHVCLTDWVGHCAFYGMLQNSYATLSS